MATNYVYDINFFHWNKESRIFSASESDLWIRDYKQCFPSGGKQFTIKNYTSGGFRRFRLEEETGEFYKFKAQEDDILCIVYKTRDIIDLLKELVNIKVQKTITKKNDRRKANTGIRC